ncbi:hypothetical protein [Amycolatopsis sp. cmx-4-68]|uniref:hypothetical protein n=1 Tax=Amycolatopsis sp. cmx-4-68 TaxID=2790938 RepID=UPI0039786F95
MRAAVAEELMLGARPDDRVGPVLLVIDELVGNAYRHATTPKLLRVGRACSNVPARRGDGR